MLNVTFMRHAKSDWNIYDGNDFNRCVSEEGINKTKRIGLFIKNNNFFFDEALCSPALRAKKTLDIISTFIKKKPKIKYIEDLYYTSRKNLFDILMLHAEKSRCLVVSHEPLLSYSIESFFTNYKNQYSIKATQKYSTSSIFNVSFSCKNWFEINEEIATINFFKRPKDLIL